MTNYKLRVKNVEGLTKVFEAEHSLALGDLIATLLPVCGNKLELVVTREEEDPDERLD